MGRMRVFCESKFCKVFIFREEREESFPSRRRVDLE